MQPILSGITPTNDNPFRITIDFGEYTNGVDAVDAFEGVVVTNGATVTGSLVVESPGQDVFSFEVLATLEGPLTAQIPAGTYTCSTSGTLNEVSNLLTIVYDATAPDPLLSLAPGETTPTNDPFWVRIHFGEGISGADLPAIETFIDWTNCSKGTGGTGGWAPTASPQEWDLHVQPGSEGAVSVQLLAGAYSDGAGNPSLASNVLSSVYDTTAPTPVITLKSGEADPTNSPFWVSIDFGEGISGADLPSIEAALTWVNCAKGTGGTSGWQPTASPQVWELHVNPTTEGTVSVQLSAGAYSDSAGNPSSASNLYTNEYDITAPVPVITLKSGEADPANSPFWVSIDFHEGITGADLPAIEAGITWSSCAIGTGGTGGWAPTASPQVWELHVAPTVEGTVTVRIGAGVYSDSAGNASEQSNLFSNVYDTTGPAPDISLKVGEPATATGPFWVSIDFDEGITGADLPAIEAGLTWTNCTKGTGGTGGWAPTASPEIYELQVVPTTTGLVSLQLGAGVYQDSASNPNTASNLFSISYVEPAPGKDVVLMMDFSNSMNWPVTIGTDTAPKIDFMLPAINQFVDEWAAFADAGDRFGLVSFESVATKLTASLQSFDGPTAQGLINSVTAQGNTAMGPAMGLGLLDLLSANTSDADYGRERAAILFADGQDNITPLVNTAAGTFSVDAVNNGGYPHTLGPLVVNSSDPDKIPVHTVGIGETAAWLDKLNHIASVSGGMDKATPTSQIWPGMISGLQDILTAIYSGSSPQVVFRKKGRLATKGAAGETQSGKFFLDASVTKIVVSVTWLGNEPLKLTVKKGGQRIYQFDNVIRKDDQRYLIVELALPHYRYLRPKRMGDGLFMDATKKLDAGLLTSATARGASAKKEAGVIIKDVSGRAIPIEVYKKLFCQKITARGQWEVVVERANSKAMGAIDYNLSVIADEKAVQCEAEQPSVAYTGDPIPLQVRVREKSGKPIARITRAEAIVTSPRFAAADVLSKYSGRVSKAKSKEVTQGSSLLAAKMATLSQIPEAAAELDGTVVTRVRLMPPRGRKRTMGVYCGLFKRPTVPGTYRVQYRIQGISRLAGVFERIIERTVNVKVKVSRARTEIVAKGLVRGELLWTIVPKDAYGNRLGAGYTEVLKAELGEKVNAKITDNLDGTYTMAIRKKDWSVARKRTVRLSVAGQTIYRGVCDKLLCVARTKSILK